jgi:molecular chaperone DnaK
MLSEKYGANKIKVSEKPMLAIAEGAAILSHRLGDEYEASIDDEPAISEISYSTNHNYYLEIAEGDSLKMKRVIEKQTPLPVEMSKNFKTTTNNQKVVKVSIYSDVEDGKYEMQALGFYLIDDNLPIESELIFNFYMDINENLTVKVAPKGKKSLAKQIVLGRGNIDQKALQTIDELILKSVKEFRTLDGEEAFLKYISQRIKEIEKLGATEVDDNKWHEIYYNTTEKYDEIKRTEHGSSQLENAVYRAKKLILEFGELLDPLDKASMINLITQIESSVDETDKIQFTSSLIQKTDKYSLFSAALQIESLANRILNIPATPVGETKKQKDVKRLEQLSVDVKTKFKMNQDQSATTLIDEAYAIIEKYKESL